MARLLAIRLPSLYAKNFLFVSSCGLFSYAYLNRTFAVRKLTLWC